MKNLLILTLGYLLFATGIAEAQVKCPIPCAQEEFPYLYCPDYRVVCSDDPIGAGGQPVKAYLPNCIHVDQTVTSGSNTISGMPPVGKVQAYGIPPGPEPVVGDPPDRQAIWDRYWSSGFDDLTGGGFIVPPWHRPYDIDDNQDDWGYDPDEYQAACDQFSLDSSNFLNDDDTSQIDETGFTSNEINVVNWYFNTDYAWLNETYMAEEDTFEADSTAYAKWQVDSANVQYVTVWNDTAAQDDANLALSEWYSACPGLQQNNCCVRVNFDQNANHFNQVDYSINVGSPIVLANTPLPSCTNDSTCPDSNVNYIDVNVSSDFLFASNAVNPAPNPNYPFPVATHTFFTGASAPEVQIPYFETNSFRLVIEHELGHWLGFTHSYSNDTPNTYSCSNNVDSCGANSVMIPYETANTDPYAVTCEDLNMFRKLYCPESPCVECPKTSGVSSTYDEGSFNPKLYPNPTTGECSLTYQVADQSFVQVAVYDVLGNPVRTVSSDYEGEGQHTISLGTESLPSGNYVCRVRVGDRAAYINLAIVK